MDAALGSREIAAEHFVIWGGALLATPTLLYTVRTTSAYPFLRWRSLEMLQMVALGDRLFFIVWAMLVAMLLVSLLWEGLYPDRTDQQILGVLPVSARMVAAARVATALGAALVLITAIVVPTAVFYAATSGVHPVLGARLGVMAGQIVGGVSAGMFVFTTLMTVRGLLVYVLGAGAAARVAVVLQVITVLLLVEAFLFLPGILPRVLRPLMTPGAADVTWMVPAWFLGLSVWVAGPHRDLLGVMAGDAVAAVLAVVMLAVAVYVAPAPATARRVLETRTTARPRGIGTWLTALASRTGVHPVVAGAAGVHPAQPRPQSAAPDRHRLVAGAGAGRGRRSVDGGSGARTAAGAGRSRRLPRLAAAGADVLPGRRPARRLRAADGCAGELDVPADREPRACLLHRCHARRPVAAGGDAGERARRGWWAAGCGDGRRRWRVAAMHAVSGVALCEIAVLDCESIPFTRQRGLSTNSLKVGAPLGLVALILYAFTLDDAAVAGARRQDGVWWYTGIGLLLTGAIAAFGQRRARPPIPCFDAPTEEMTALSLSGARG